MTSELITIPVSMTDPHPANPRLVMREDVVEQIASQIGESGFQQKHAVHTRRVGNRYQILSGHHRFAAAARAGLAELPAWVEDLDDDRAYMELVLSNAQGELSPLEIGMHALHWVAKGNGGRGQKGGLREYASRIGRDESFIRQIRKAAEVAEKCGANSALLTKTQHLSAIHTLPESCWPVAVEAMLAKGWSAKDTAERIKTANEFVIPDGYSDIYQISDVINRNFSGDFSPQSFKKIISQCRRAEDLVVIHASGDDVGAMVDVFRDWLRQEQPFTVAPIVAYERRLAAEFKKSEKSAEEFKLGNWRDHVCRLTDGSVALLLTDPPYGMNYQSNRRAERYDRIANDGADEAANEIRECLQAMHPKMADSSHLLVFAGWRHEPNIRSAIEAAGYQIRGSLIWKKNNHGSGDLRGSFAPMHERIIHAVKGNPALVLRMPDVIDADKVATDRHPTEKPTELLDVLIEATTVDGELVADPFAGVASTLVSAKKSSRVFWGCELNEKYHQAGICRL